MRHANRLILAILTCDPVCPALSYGFIVYMTVFNQGTSDTARLLCSSLDAAAHGTYATYDNRHGRGAWSVDMAALCACALWTSPDSQLPFERPKLDFPHTVPSLPRALSISITHMTQVS